MDYGIAVPLTTLVPVTTLIGFLGGVIGYLFHGWRKHVDTNIDNLWKDRDREIEARELRWQREIEAREQRWRDQFKLCTDHFTRTAKLEGRLNARGKK